MDGDNRGKKDKKKRRRRLRSAISAFRQRAEQVCRPIGNVDAAVNRISQLANEIRQFVEATEARELLPAKARRGLEAAAEGLEKVKERTESMAEACGRVQKALKYADQVITPGFPTVAVVVATAVVGIGVVAGVILTNSVTVIVESDKDCGPIVLPSAANFLPGIELPREIPGGGQSKVKIPRAFVGSFTVSGQQASLEALGRHIPLSTGNLDLPRSSWDGAALSGLEGKPISVTGDREHLLRLFCR